MGLFSKSLKPKAWIIDPEKQTITERQVSAREWESLISEIVGDDAEPFTLDNYGNKLWYSDTDTNDRYAYYIGMVPPSDVRRYSKGLIISLGPIYWNEDTIRDWLCWYDKQNVWGDV